MSHLRNLSLIASLNVGLLIKAMDELPSAKRARLETSQTVTLATLCVKQLLKHSQYLAHAFSVLPIELIEMIIKNIERSSIPNASLSAIQVAIDTAPLNIACYLWLEFPKLSAEKLQIRVFRYVKDHTWLTPIELQFLAQSFRPLSATDKDFSETLPPEIYTHKQAGELFALLFKRHQDECNAYPYPVRRGLSTPPSEADLVIFRKYKSASIMYVLPNNAYPVEYELNNNRTLVAFQDSFHTYIGRVDKESNVYLEPKKIIKIERNKGLVRFSSDNTFIELINEYSCTRYKIPTRYLEGKITLKQLVFIMMFHHLYEADPCHEFTESENLIRGCNLLENEILETFAENDADFFSKRLNAILKYKRKARPVVFRNSPGISEEEKRTFASYFSKHELRYLIEDLSNISSLSFQKQLYKALLIYLQKTTPEDLSHFKPSALTPLPRNAMSDAMRALITHIVAMQNASKLNSFKNDMLSILEAIRR